MDSNRRGRPDNSSAATLRMSWGIERSLVPRFGHWGAVSRIASPLRHYVHLLCINNTVQIMVDVTFCGQHPTPSSCASVAGSQSAWDQLCPQSWAQLSTSSWAQPRSFPVVVGTTAFFPGVVGGTVFLSRHSARNGIPCLSFCAERYSLPVILRGTVFPSCHSARNAVESQNPKHTLSTGNPPNKRAAETYETAIMTPK